MKNLKTVALLCVLCGASACTGFAQGNAARSQTAAYKAQAEVSKERLALVEQYQTCVTEAGENAMAVEACDLYLRSAEALN